MHAVFIGSIIPHPVRRFKSSQHSLHKRVWDRYIINKAISTCYCFSRQALQGVALLQLRHRGFSGYHQGNNEVLPQSVALAETLAVSSLWVWLIAGFTTAAVRMLDEDADGLPIGPGFCPHALPGCPHKSFLVGNHVTLGS